jgi:hypothetical protein
MSPNRYLELKKRLDGAGFETMPHDEYIGIK